MRESPFNDNQRAICSAHWNGKDSGCHKCPIRVPCHTGHRLTEHDLALHRERINNAADAVVAAAAIDAQRREM